jgi:prepilin-type N-terminal cleavage/methylation domain-containing protein
MTREDGFTLTELMVATTVMLLVIGSTLATFGNAVNINDTASQLADANQNLRAGTNELVRDLMMAGRIIANGGVPVPNGGGALAVNRPGPPGTALTFGLIADDDGTVMLCSITPGWQLGPTINGSTTDMVTILTADEFMPALLSVTAAPTNAQAIIAADGSNLTLPNTSLWLVGDATYDTTPIAVGDLVLFKNANGMAIQSVTSTDTTHVYFGNNDWFNFNQRSAAYAGTIMCIKASTACDTLPVSAAVMSEPFGPPDAPTTAVMRLQMITYYVDNVTTSGTPRLTRLVNHGTPQALAGVVEDLDLTYDLVDSTTTTTITGQTSLPVTINGVTYTSNMIKTVNLHMGVRSETISKPLMDYVRNHISTAVAVRSLESVDRYDTSQ